MVPMVLMVASEAAYFCTRECEHTVQRTREQKNKTRNRLFPSTLRASTRPRSAVAVKEIAERIDGP